MKQYKEYKSTIEDVDAKGRVLVAANAIGNVDADGDRSLNGSFDKTLKENFNRLKWFLNHDRNLLLGVPVEGSQDGRHLKLLGQLNMKKQISLDTYEDYKLYAEYGKSLEHSIGVDAVKHAMNGDVRDVSEWRLWEYSTLTSWGANWDTSMLGIKSLNDIPASIDWLELKLKKGNFSDERFVLIEKQLHLLRSLCTEPQQKGFIECPKCLKLIEDKESGMGYIKCPNCNEVVSTQKAKPNDKQDALILTINNFVKQLNSTQDGRKSFAGSS